jgi:chemotaxis protein MotB
MALHTCSVAPVRNHEQWEGVFKTRSSPNACEQKEFIPSQDNFLGIGLAQAIPIPSVTSATHKKEEIMLGAIPDWFQSVRTPLLLLICTLLPIGCVTKETHTKTLTELSAAKQLSAQQAAELDALKKKSEAQSEQLQQQLAGLQQKLDQEAADHAAAEQRAATLAQEKAALETRSSNLQSQLDGLERDRSNLNSELGNVKDQIAALEKKLADETAQVSALEKDKTQLESGTASAQDEIARLQKRAAELETQSARIGKEREQLRDEQSKLAATLEQERQRLKEEEAEKARLAQERERLRDEHAALTANLEQERQRAEAEAAEKARLEKERHAKEEEIKRLTRTQEELSKSLQDEIAKGNITIQQVRDKLTINMVDRVLFDSGRAEIKPAGLKVLKQVGDVLKTVTDKQIRIEGHTDNVPISTKLQDRFKTNWELSTARATTVVRYLIDQGGVDREQLSAVGYADTRPVATNDTDEGRSSNRRIEIVLYPKDLSQIVGSVASAH